MKRFPSLAIATAVAFGGITGARDLAAQTRPDGPIVVKLNQVNGKFQVLEPGETHKVRVGRGDTIVWRFENLSSIDTAAKIGKIETPLIYRGKKDPRRKKTPFASECKLRLVKVPHENSNAPAEFKCRIRTDIKDVSSAKSLTYKYAILGSDGKTVLVDPEIEIDK